MNEIRIFNGCDVEDKNSLAYKCFLGEMCEFVLFKTFLALKDRRAERYVLFYE